MQEMKMMLLYKTIFVLSFGYIFYYICLIWVYYRLYKRLGSINTKYTLYIFSKKYTASHIYEYIYLVIFLIISIILTIKYIKYTTFFQIVEYFYSK